MINSKNTKKLIERFSNKYNAKEALKRLEKLVKEKGEKLENA